MEISSNVNAKVSLQLLLVVLGIYLVSAFRLTSTDNDGTEIQSSLHPFSSHIEDGEDFKCEYPEYRFGSTSKWQNFLEEHENQEGFMHLTGTGNLNYGSIEVDVLLIPGKQIIGRYRHENGTTLDFNGYLDQQNNLFVHLGHGNELSDWTLHQDKYDNNSVSYSGEWGRKHLASDLTLSIK